jgi:hypothetical protein
MEMLFLRIRAWGTESYHLGALQLYDLVEALGRTPKNLLGRLPQRRSRRLDAV